MNVFGKEIPTETICIFEPGTTKNEALDRLVDTIVGTGVATDRDAFRKALYDREAVRSTGFKRVAIPHVRIDEISEPSLGVGISKSGIEFDALDNDTVNIIVLFAMPSGSDKEYLGWLAQVMMTLRTSGFVDLLLACNSPEEVLSVLENHGE